MLSSPALTPTLSFNQSIDLMFSTSDHGKPSILAQRASRCMEKMVRFSCHITFLVQCHNHDLVPNGLELKDPVRNSESSKILHLASMMLLKQQLKLNRISFAQNKKCFDATMSTLKQLLSESYYAKMLSFNISTSHRCHSEHFHKHKKKFQMLIDKHKVPYLNPCDSIRTFDISAPTFTGTLNQQKPVIREEINVVKNTVVNLTDEALTEEEIQLLSLGLKFCPTSESDPVAKTSSKLEPVLKKLGLGTESAATHEVASTLLGNKKKPSNLNTKQKMALKSLKKKSNNVKIVPADKGNSAVNMTNTQYFQKMEDHLNTSTYSLLKKNPTDSLSPEN